MCCSNDLSLQYLLTAAHLWLTSLHSDFGFGAVNTHENI